MKNKIFYSITFALLFTTQTTIFSNNLKEFFEKIETGTIQEVKEAGKKITDINAKDEHGTSAIKAASYCGDLEILKYIVEERKCKLNLNIIIDAIHTASTTGDVNITKYLLEISDKLKKLPVGYHRFFHKGYKKAAHIACKENHFPLVKYMIDNGYIKVEDINEKLTFSLEFFEEYSLLETILEKLLQNKLYCYSWTEKFLDKKLCSMPKALILNPQALSSILPKIILKSNRLLHNLLVCGPNKENEEIALIHLVSKYLTFMPRREEDKKIKKKFVDNFLNTYIVFRILHGYKPVTITRNSNNTRSKLCKDSFLPLDSVTKIIEFSRYECYEKLTKTKIKN